MNNDIFFIFIDDLHLLNPLDCDVVAALSWLPTSLPWNVQLICSTTTPIDQLRFTPIQRDRFKSAEFLFDLSTEENHTELHKPLAFAAGLPDICFTDFVAHEFDRLEVRHGRRCVARLSGYITCSEFGLSETELLELLMPTEDPEMFVDSDRGNFNFSSFKQIHNDMSEYESLRIMCIICCCLLTITLHF